MAGLYDEKNVLDKQICFVYWFPWKRADHLRTLRVQMRGSEIRV